MKTITTNRNFWSFWLAQVISQFGDRINQMALVGLVAARHPGSSIELAKILAFTIIPVFIVGPVAGVYVDRWDRKTTLFVCDFLRGALVLTIPWIFINWNSMVPIYIVIFLTFCLSRFYVPAKMSFVPDLVDEGQLHIANSLVSVTGMIAFVLGAYYGGMMVEKIGPRGGFFWDAMTFFISGSLVFSLSRMHLRISGKRILKTGREVIDVLHKNIFEDIKEGIQYIGAQKEIKVIIGIMSILFLAAGSIYIVLIIFIQQTFDSVTKDLGVLAVYLGAGLFLGSVAYARWGKKVSNFLMIFLCLILGGAMLGLFAYYVDKTQDLFGAKVLAAILGFVVGPIVIASNTIVHFVCSSEMRGKVFSALEFVMHLAFLIAMFTSSFLSKIISTRDILIGVGGIFLIVGIIGIFRVRELKELES